MCAPAEREMEQGRPAPLAAAIHGTGLREHGNRGTDLSPRDGPGADPNGITVTTVVDSWV